MDAKSAAAYLWGMVLGVGIAAVLGILTLDAVLGATFTWGVIFILSVLWDEWRHPATSYREEVLANNPVAYGEVPGIVADKSESPGMTSYTWPRVR